MKRKIEQIIPTQNELLQLSCASVFSHYCQTTASKIDSPIRPGFICRHIKSGSDSVLYCSDVCGNFGLFYQVVYDKFFAGWRKSGKGLHLLLEEVEITDLPDMENSDSLKEKLQKSMSTLLGHDEQTQNVKLDTPPVPAKETTVELSPAAKALSKMLSRGKR